MEGKNNISNIEQLILKCLQGKASPEEYRKTWDWVHANPENQEHYNSIRDSWITTGLINDVAEEKIDLEWEKLNKRMKSSEKKITMTPSRKPIQIRKLLSIAALFIFAISLGYTLRYLETSPARKKELLHEYVVEAPHGSKVALNLEDGTKVWLNAGSKLKYTNQYNLKKREVYLEGEGYFEVAKDKKKPFNVYAKNTVVKALGTAFNVKAYPEEDHVETTLVEGKVRIEDGKKELILLPNQKATFYAKTEKVIKTTTTTRRRTSTPPKLPQILKDIDSEIYTSWKEDRWKFKGEDLFALSKKLERIYNVKIVFEDEQLKEYKLSGTLEQETFEQVLKAIQLTIPLNYTIKHNVITVSLDRSKKKDFNKLIN